MIGGLTITRLFDAPRARVFAAWSEPEQMKRWYAPKGLTLSFCSNDLRPGGVLLYCMRSPEGQDFWAKGVYQEVAVPERFAYIDTFADEKGNVVAPSAYGAPPAWPDETVVTVTFEEIGAQTRVTLHQTVAEAVARQTGAYEAWTQMLDNLAVHLA